MTGKRTDITGCWTLKSCYIEVVDTGERLYPYGENPVGTLIIHESGRMVAVFTPSARMIPTTETDKAKAFEQLVAYSGRYRLEGARFVTDVDVSWLPQWVGTAQGRKFALHDDLLDIISDPAPSPFFDGVLVQGKLTWAREAGQPDAPTNRQVATTAR
jgi:hypothetical protein